MNPTIPDLLEAAEAFALGAGRITLEYYGGLVEAEDKSDGSPVTRADREAELYIREQIELRFPGHGVLGEEFPEANPDSPVRWILDPIDGTRSFMRGVPLYGVRCPLPIILVGQSIAELVNKAHCQC